MNNIKKLTHEVYENEFFTINKQVNEFIGLWPYLSTKRKIFVRYLVSFTYFIHVVAQASGTLMYIGKDFISACECIIGTTFSALYFIRYLLVVGSESKLKNLYAKIARNWLATSDPAEKNILIKYATQGKLITMIYIGQVIISGVAMTQLPMTPIVLDFVFPLNESRNKVLIMKGDYIIDAFEHYFKFYLFITMSGVIFCSASASIDTMYYVNVHQAAGIYDVVKHRLRESARKNVSYSIHYHEIIEAIRLHKNALKLINTIDASYSRIFLVDISACVIVLAISALSITHSELLDIIRASSISIAMLLYLFFMSWPAQMVIDESDELFRTIFAIEWYNLSQNSKVLLHIMMRKCIIPNVITAGGLYVMSFENYGLILKSTVSYATFMISCSK